jgi:hypothetical protein
MVKDNSSKIGLREVDRWREPHKRRTESNTLRNMMQGPPLASNAEISDCFFYDL